MRERKARSAEQLLKDAGKRNFLEGRSICIRLPGRSNTRARREQKPKWRSYRFSKHDYGSWSGTLYTFRGRVDRIEIDTDGGSFIWHLQVEDLATMRRVLNRLVPGMQRARRNEIAALRRHERKKGG